MDLSMFHTTDEDGNEVEKPRPETKSFEDVHQCIHHHKGQNDTVVELFVSMYLLGIQWDWFTLYKEWQTQCADIKTWNDNRKPDEDGNLPDERPLPDMPPRPQQGTVGQWKLDNFNVLREGAYRKFGEQFDEQFWGIKNGDMNSGDWIRHRESVKAQYPKPTQ